MRAPGGTAPVDLVFDGRAVGGGGHWHGEESTVSCVVKVSRAVQERPMDRINREGQPCRFRRTLKVMSVVAGEEVGR
jgi:hypothetical protein